MIEQMIDFVQQQAQTNDIFSGAVLGGLVLGGLHYLRTVPKIIGKWILYRTTVTTYFTNQDDGYQYLRMWLDQIDFSSYNRRFHAVLLGADYDPISNTSTPKFALTPYSGIYIFRHDRKLVMLQVTKNEPSADNGSFMFFETVKIIYIGRSLNFLTNSIIEPLREQYRKEHQQQISVWINQSEGFWRKGNIIEQRPLSTVVLQDQDQTEYIQRDIQSFIDNKDFYKQTGVPYHRGYLLTGPPGTGKTSLIYAIASEFGRDIFVLNLACLTDDKLTSLFQENILHNSIVVIEDIDTVFEGRNNVADTSGAKAKVNFSTLINCIDGFGAPSGLILMMTTNHPQHLDPALIRPGRVDQTIRLTYCNQYQISQLFERFYLNVTEQQKQQVCNVIEQDKYSPATIQGWFLAYDKQQILDDQFDREI